MKLRFLWFFFLRKDKQHRFITSSSTCLPRMPIILTMTVSILQTRFMPVIHLGLLYIITACAFVVSCQQKKTHLIFPLDKSLRPPKRTSSLIREGRKHERRSDKNPCSGIALRLTLGANKGDRPSIQRYVHNHYSEETKAGVNCAGVRRSLSN